MKALILKDFYMLKSYFKYYFVLISIFVLSTLYQKEFFSFFIFYPSVICSMITVSLLGYDERSKWSEYSCAFPYTKAQVVSSKYIIGLILLGAVTLFTSLVQIIRMNIYDHFKLNEFFIFIAVTIILSLLSQSFSLPNVFKYGVEKGRLGYYVLIGISALLPFVNINIYGEIFKKFSIYTILTTILLIIVLLYILSWYLSIKFYQKRVL